MVPCTVEGSRPIFSITSISPHLGQPTLLISLPSIQNAGHIPCPEGILMRASNRPYACLKLPTVFMRAELYWHRPYQHRFLRGRVSLMAVITRFPFPSI